VEEIDHLHCVCSCVHLVFMCQQKLQIWVVTCVPSSVIVALSLTHCHIF